MHTTTTTTTTTAATARNQKSMADLKRKSLLLFCKATTAIANREKPTLGS
jgi:hypothetical protein